MYLKVIIPGHGELEIPLSLFIIHTEINKNDNDSLVERQSYNHKNDNAILCVHF